MILDGSGIRLDPSEFDGDWDYVYAARGTKSAVVITKYKCIKDGKLLPPGEWEVRSYYDVAWGTKLYREERLNRLLNETEGSIKS